MKSMLSWICKENEKAEDLNHPEKISTLLQAVLCKQGSDSRGKAHLTSKFAIRFYKSGILIILFVSK